MAPHAVVILADGKKEGKLPGLPVQETKKESLVHKKLPGLEVIAMAVPPSIKSCDGPLKTKHVMKYRIGGNLIVNYTLDVHPPASHPPASASAVRLAHRCGAYHELFLK